MKLIQPRFVQLVDFGIQIPVYHVLVVGEASFQMMRVLQ